MNPEELQGRFLPSRVFSRWKWTVRFGLLGVPLILFLSGSLQLYLSPGRYPSSTVFEIVNGPSLRESEELLRSANVLTRVIEKLELAGRLELDRESCLAVIRKNLDTQILKDTRMIRLVVTLTRNTDARDIAEEIPRALVQYLADSMRARSNEKLAELHRLESVEIDRARELSVQWIKLVDVHGQQPAEPGAVIAIERARRATLRAEAEAGHLNSLKQAEQTSLIHQQPRLVVHTEPRVSCQPESPKTGSELGRIVLGCLAWALASALLLPYLLELAFPPSHKGNPALAPTADF